MTAYAARLRIEGEDIESVPVVVDLTGDHVKLIVGTEEVADWSRDEMGIATLAEGFRIRAEGETVVLDVDEAADFALELRLRHAHPTLRKRMAARLRPAEPRG
jgi:hypothetical protein